MAARITPSKGSRPDKIMRDALILELSEQINDGDAGKVKRLRLVARKLVSKALGGDVPALKEVFDRVDGKAPQSVDLNHGITDPLAQLLKEIDGKTRNIIK